MPGNRLPRSRTARSLVGYLALTALLVTLTGCGAGASTGGASTGPTSTPGAAAPGSTSTDDPTLDTATQGSTTQDSTTQNTTTQNTTTQDTGTKDTTHDSTTQKSKTNVIDWILRLGVGSPTGPAFDYLEHYDALRKQDCQAALGGGDGARVVAAAAKACLAAQGSSGSDTLWSEAATARDSFQSDSLNCLDAVAYGLLDQLVKAHVEHPDRTFQFVSGENGQGDPQCPALTGSKPDSGPSGAVVTLKGIRLSSDDQVAVRFGQGDPQPLQPFDQTDTRIRVTMPNADAGSVATIEVTSPRLPWTMTAEFRYDGSSSSSTETTGTETTSTETTSTETSSTETSSTTDTTSTETSTAGPDGATGNASGG